MDLETFVADENWLGSYYELCLELGPTGDDERLANAVATLWSQPQLFGYWNDRVLYKQPPSPIEITDGFISPLYGIISLDCGQQLGCVTHAVRETDGSDWLDLCIPTGMLELVFDVRYPLEYQTNPWMRTIDRVLSRITEAMFRVCPFKLGIIGEEASGLTSAKSIAAADCRDSPFFFPESLWASLGLQREHRMTVPGLVSIGLPDPE